MGSNKPVRDEYEVIYVILNILNYSFIELFHILNYFIYCSIYEIFHMKYFIYHFMADQKCCRLSNLKSNAKNVKQTKIVCTLLLGSLSFRS